MIKYTYIFVWLTGSSVTTRHSEEGWSPDLFIPQSKAIHFFNTLAYMKYVLFNLRSQIEIFRDGVLVLKFSVKAINHGLLGYLKNAAHSDNIWGLAIK